MRIFGILNITADSFSDGGRYLDPRLALEHANTLLASGADVLDIGPASSHPDSRPVAPEDQIERLRPIFAAKIDRKLLSIDCTNIDVQRFAIRHGVGYINDIRGFSDPEIYSMLADSDTSLVVMHSISTSEIAQRIDIAPDEILARVYRFFDQRLEGLLASGIARGRIILDPGMGFFLGTNPQTSVEILRRLPEIRRRYELPILVSVSRKSFLQRIAGTAANTSQAATLAAEIYCVEQGVDFLRTHDPKPLLQGVAVWRALREGRVDGEPFQCQF